MMKIAAGSLLLLLVVASATPVDKVITLLTKLTAQVQSEGANEAASYDKYSCFCKAQATDKLFVIAKSKKKIEVLDAEIVDLTTQISAADGIVSGKTTEQSGEEKTLEENQGKRNTEIETYQKARKEAVEAVEAVVGALEVMQTAGKDVQGSLAGLLQKNAKLSSMPALALIAGATGAKKYTGPGEAHAYKYESKEVIATLQGLVATFKQDLATLDENDRIARDTFQMARGARSNVVTALKKKIAEAEVLSAAKGEIKSEKENIRTEETTAMNADQAFLDDLTAKCSAKAAAWDQRSTARADELTALAEATELLKGMGDSYNANSKLVGLISKHTQPVFLQLRRASLDIKKLQSLTSHLSDLAASLDSTPLAMLAVQLKAAGPDHFVKVRGLIRDLIGKLEADAASEATQKGVCDKNMKAAITKRDKQAALIEKANAEIDTTAANIVTLKNEISDLAVDIAGLNKELLEATELRTGEKADNEKTVANANTGLKAVDDAIAVLNTFYGTTLLQVGAGYTPPKSGRDGKTVGDLAPETFSSDETYAGNKAGSKGIIGIMEVISSDFGRTVSVTEAAEAQAVKDFDGLKKDLDKSVRDKTELKETKETDVETKEGDLTGFKDDLKDATTMNEEALDELDKLKASCVEGGETYAERVKHRNEEIEALKQAMELLDSMAD